MSFIKANLAASTLLLLAGCAASPEFLAERAQLEKMTPTCSGEADCNAKWQAAHHWVLNDAGFTIYSATDKEIDTYSLGQQDERIIARVTKEPLGDGKYRIVATLHCTSPWVCVPNEWQATRDFDRTVAAAKP